MVLNLCYSLKIIILDLKATYWNYKYNKLIMGPLNMLSVKMYFMHASWHDQY